MPLPVGVHLGAYEVTALLGAGAMGEVYRARDTKLGREVALKVLRGVQASTNGGVLPAWSRDGTELFYVEGTTLMGVRVDRRGEADLDIGVPSKLLSAADVSSPLRSFDFRLWCPTDDGFLVVQRGVTGRPFVAAMQNWQRRLSER